MLISFEAHSTLILLTYKMFNYYLHFLTKDNCPLKKLMAGKIIISKGFYLSMLLRFLLIINFKIYCTLFCICNVSSRGGRKSFPKQLLRSHR